MSEHGQNKTHFDVSHRLFVLMLNGSQKDSKVEEQWKAVLRNAQKAGVDIPAETIKKFVNSRPDLAKKMINEPA